ncbi:MAG: hypothetical protein ACFCU8_17630 [Thermosynechococcaceae cyanobacterium]
MLCNTCLRQRVCLTRKMALSDGTLKPMLQRLQKCELRIVRSGQQHPQRLQRLYALMRGQGQSARLFFAAKQPK